MKDKIKKHLERNGKFLVIGKDTYNIAKKISHLQIGGSSIFDNVNTLQVEAQQTFYSLLREPNRVVIGTIEKEVKLPKIIKENCMILRSK